MFSALNQQKLNVYLMTELVELLKFTAESPFRASHRVKQDDNEWWMDNPAMVLEKNAAQECVVRA